MGNTSATGGYLQPLSSSASEGDPFVNFMQEVVVGISGLSDTMVRPRWATDLVEMPAHDINWASLGVQSEKNLNVRGSVRHDPNGSIAEEPDSELMPDGTDVLTRTVQTRLLVSFYGPAGHDNAAKFSDGLAIAQNREALALASIGLVDIGERRTIPELVNNKWLLRIDLELIFNREIQRVYPVFSLLKAEGTIHANRGSSTIETDFDTDNRRT